MAGQGLEQSILFGNESGQGLAWVMPKSAISGITSTLIEQRRERIDAGFGTDAAHSTKPSTVFLRQTTDQADYS